MRHLFYASILCILATSVSAENVIFVKQGGNGPGTSWEDATSDLAAALFAAKYGDEVWVAAGMYFPTTDKNRKTSFIIPSGVKVYGGFAGHETSPQERDFQQNKSVLSGNIGSVGDMGDNSSTIVHLQNADEHTLLDGFVIADGTANGTGPTADRNRCGAALYIDGSGQGGKSAPIIQNCIFQNNEARDGGAVYLNGRNGHCNASFRNCQFLSNKADLDGGAIFNDGRHGGKASPEFHGCTFSGNKGNYGGAICNYGGRGESSPNLQKCVFHGNEAYLRGGAIFNMDVEGVTKPVINGCQFVDNKAVSGKGVYTFSRPKENYEGTQKTNVKMN